MKAIVSTGNITPFIVARLTKYFVAVVFTIAFLVNCVSADTIISAKEIVAPTAAENRIESGSPVDLSQLPNKTYLPILANRQRSTTVWDSGK
ncbi:MAG: hypothetical protein KIH69_021460 [Anaerolineae bacterium]|nr:hypothetical protein [Anaerolineae bacterium]